MTTSPTVRVRVPPRLADLSLALMDQLQLLDPEMREGPEVLMYHAAKHLMRESQRIEEGPQKVSSAPVLKMVSSMVKMVRDQNALDQKLMLPVDVPADVLDREIDMLLARRNQMLNAGVMDVVSTRTLTAGGSQSSGTGAVPQDGRSQGPGEAGQPPHLPPPGAAEGLPE